MARMVRLANPGCSFDRGTVSSRRSKRSRRVASARSRVQKETKVRLAIARALYSLECRGRASRLVRELDPGKDGGGPTGGQQAALRSEPATRQASVAGGHRRLR